LVSSSGEWSGNLYDFFFKAYNKIVQNPCIKIPFKIENGLNRVDDTPVHKAIREALVNCLTNADFYGERGLVIKNYTDKIIMENPGGFRLSINEAISGGISSPRNSVIMKMFNLLDIGERAGSGVPNIYHTWKMQNWDKPVYTEHFDPGRSILTLPINKAPLKSADKKVPIKSTDKKVPIKSTNKKQTERTAQQKSVIIGYIREKQIIKSGELLAVLDVKEERIKKILQQMLTEGLIVSEGGKRNRTYKLP
jgi:predicted HTH transcriptional regulator